MASAFAGALAAQSGGSVHVFYVNEHLVACKGVLLLTADDARALVTRTIDHLHTAGVSADGSIRVAPCRHVPRLIAGAALAQGADGIVLGSRRQRRFGRLFSGNVRERTTRHSSLPVLTAPSPLGLHRGGISFDDAIEAELQRMTARP